MMKTLSKYCFIVILLFVSCSCSPDAIHQYVGIVHERGLTFYYPNYSRIDFTCDVFDPSTDSTIIFACAAAFTGANHNSDPHLMIAQNHVCFGVKFRGYRCPRCNGAFIWYNGKYQFILDDYATSMDSAAANGGTAFSQELMIHEGRQLNTKRSRTNVN